MLSTERQLTPDDRVVVWVLLRSCLELTNPLLICGNCTQHMVEIERVCGFCRQGMHKNCIVEDRERQPEPENDGLDQEYASYWCCPGCARDD